MAVGRISGPLLKDNLLRNGVDLAFETDLLYLDVTNGRVGINKKSPGYELDVTGTTKTTNLQVNNQADIGTGGNKFTLSGNTIASTNSTINLLPSGANPVIYQAKISVNSDLQITTNTISTTVTDSDLTLNTAGTGKVIVNASMDVNGDLHVTGDITADGTINVGDVKGQDNVVFKAEVESNFIPNQDNSFTLGSNPLTIDPETGELGKEWANLYAHNIYSTNLTTSGLVVNGIDLALPQGNTFYVASTGSDSYIGTHQNAPFATVKHALSQTTSGDTVYIYPGTYTEIFPLTVPAGVTVKGASLRSVKIVPTTATRYNDAFLVNGETTVEDLTVADYFSGGNFFTVTAASAGSTTVNVGTAPFAHTYVSGGTITIGSTVYTITNAVYTYTTGVLVLTHTGGTATLGQDVFVSSLTFSCSGAIGTSTRVFPDNGYAFRFSDNFTVTTRSPYIRNITVITRGSTTSPTDPYGFDSGDAGKGAYIDGAYANALSREASMLFHSATFITPNVDTITAKNGARIEWLNSFTYFANKGINAISSAYGLARQGKTRLRINYKTGTWAVGDTVSYYDTDGTTLLASGVISDIDGNFVNLTGRCLGFETITDRAGKTVYAQGTAKLSTAQKKFGASSLVLDGVTSYASITAQPDFNFGSNDFTLECWIYPTALPTPGQYSFIAGQSKAGAGNTSCGLYLTSSGGILYLYSFGTFGTLPGAVVAQNAWSHIALTREGNSFKLWINGTQAGSTLTYSGAMTNAASTDFTIGGNAGYNLYYTGYIDDLRVSKGVCRYTGTFTAPTSALAGDLSTVLLLHFDGPNNSTTFLDDGLTTQDLRTSAGGTASIINFADYSDFGAEIRSIGSACIYGNYGVYGDGPGVIGYLISENFAYVGSGKLMTNDPNDRIAANEVVELNDAHIYYTSVDNEGNFKVGENFYVNQKTGEVLFNNQALNITTQNGVVFTDGALSTTIYPGEITTGNIKIHDNNIDSTTGPINLLAYNGIINLESNVNITGNLDVSGNVTIGGNIVIGDQNTDSVNFVAAISSDLIPATTATYNLGQLSPTELRWNNVYLTRADINGLIVENNQISTSANNDLTFSANGTGKVYVPSNDVQVDNSTTVGQNLTVTTGTTSLQAVSITGTLTQNGDYTQTGNYTTTGDVTVDGNITGTSNLVLPQVTISGNTISGTATDTDLILQADGTGIIHVTSTDVTIDQNLTVGGTLEVTGDSTFGNITVNGTITQTGDYNQTGNFVTSGTISASDITSSGILTLPGITVSNNTIESTTVDTDLTITANGTGAVSIPLNDVNIDQNLTVGSTLDVTGQTTLNGVTINGDIGQTGNFDQTGNFTTTGDVTVTGNVTLGGPITIPNITISGSSITTNANDLDLVLTANGTGKVVIQDIGINGTVISSVTPNSDITITPQGTGGVIVNSQISMVIPVGDTASRPLVGANGMVRYNSQLDRYEGFANGNWIALAGIQSSSGATRITPELTPGANDNVIRFYADNNLVATIDSTKLYAISVQTDALDISNNTISTVSTDTDINFTTSGTGGVVVGDLKFKDSEISNTVSGGITQFTEVGTGYVKIAGTYGTVLPAGNNASRPSALNAEVGMTRYNTELQYVEVWNGTVWQNVAAQSGGINFVDATSLSIVNAIVFG